VEEICLMHLGATPEPPSVRMGRPVNPELESLLLRCLAKSPSDRPQDASDLLHRLEKCPVPRRWTSTDAARWWLEHDKARGEIASSSVRK
jgi:serine/threonine-protein kinase